jgi:hypothetical protein
MNEPEKLSDKAVAYIESNLSDDCSDCPHTKKDHTDGKYGCNLCDCEERKPTNASQVWKEASEKDRLGQW